MFTNLFRLVFSARAALIAENLFLRKQLALFQERQTKPRRTARTTRLALIALSGFFDWCAALVIVKPATFVRWHRTAFRIFWRWKSGKPGRPKLPKKVRELIHQMGRENPTWGEERIANELKLKLGLRISPRTVRKYLNAMGPRCSSSQRWSTFERNHSRAMVACDFFVSVTATFRILYVFVAMEIGSRRIVHFNVTEHPTSEWTLNQTSEWTLNQFRELLAFDHPGQSLIHDRDSIFADAVDGALAGFGVRVLKTPVRAPKANAHCERLIGSIRRECLDYLIPLGERHLQSILKEYITHYNRGRPHSALGPGITEPADTAIPASKLRHQLPVGHRIRATPILSGLHHEYYLQKEAA